MIDPIDPRASEISGKDVDPGLPVRELALLAEEPAKDITPAVVEGINRRMLAGQILEVQWWGMTTLVRECLLFMLESTVKDAAKDPDSRKER